MCKSISPSSPKLWPKKGFCILAVVNRPFWIRSQPKYNQFFILYYIFCKRKMKYVHRLSRYFCNRQANRQTDKQMQANTVSPALRQAGHNAVNTITRSKKTKAKRKIPCTLFLVTEKNDQPARAFFMNKVKKPLHILVVSKFTKNVNAYIPSLLFVLEMLQLRRMLYYMETTCRVSHFNPPFFSPVQWPETEQFWAWEWKNKVFLKFWIF